MKRIEIMVAGILLLSGPPLLGQPATEPPAEKPAAPARISTCPKPSIDTVRTFYLTNVSQPNDGNEIQTAIRNLLPPDAKVYFAPFQNEVMICGTPDLFALAERVIHDLDRPKKVFRLTYTITELEGGKRVSAQHFSMIAEDGQRVTLKQGSKVPVATGSYSAAGSSSAQTQFTYLDVGMNFDATLTSIAAGGVLKTKVEQSSVAEEPAVIADVREPVIRQATLEGTSVLTLGKPLLLGSIDVPGSTRHLDVEVMMELVP